jgi:hypothetical protein
VFERPALTRFRDAFDQAVGQAKLNAKLSFACSHLTVVSLVVQTGEMQQTVQQQYSNLVAERVIVRRSLTIRGLKRDGEIASVISGNLIGSWKAKYVCRLVFAAKGLVQSAQSQIISQQNIHIALKADGCAGTIQEACQARL